MRMEKEHTLHEVVEAIAETYRRDPNIVGVWMPLDPHEPEIEFIVTQKKDQSAELTLFKGAFAPFKLYGKIVHERVESSHPIRQTVFTADYGVKRIILESREF